MILGKKFKARVVDVFKAPNGQHIHKIKLLDGTITVGDECELVIDKERRLRIQANHSSAHILQYSLQQVVSNTIHQAGSYVDDERVRFDFTYAGKMTDEKILEVEKFANEMIAEELIVSTEIMPLDKAKKLGAMALFSEKYGDMVRVVKIGKSIELCGGTHVSNTKEIGPLAVFNCESKGSNVYRIEAVTGSKIEDTLLEVIQPYNDEKIKILMKAREILEEARNNGLKLEFKVDISNDRPTSYKDIIYYRNELQMVHDAVKDLEKKYSVMKEKAALQNLDIYRDHIRVLDGIELLTMKVYHKDMKLLKSILDSLMNEMTNGFIFLMNVLDDGTVQFLAKSNSFLSAGNMVREAAVLSDGKGGGSDTFAQGGGKTVDSVSKKTSVVIVGSNPGSKYTKAQSLNIPIWTEEEFMSKIELDS